jgi:hypothetical protein
MSIRIHPVKLERYIKQLEAQIKKGTQLFIWLKIHLLKSVFKLAYFPLTNFA